MKPTQTRRFRPATTILLSIVAFTFLYFFTLSPAPSRHSRRLNTGVPLSSSIKRYDLNAGKIHPLFLGFESC